MSSLCFLSAAEAARQVRAGKVTPPEILQSHLDRIKKHNPAVNALRYVDESGAASRAAIQEQQRHSPTLRGRLHGSVFCVKDHIDVAGMPKSYGSKYSNIPQCASSAALVDLLFAEGGNCIGKSNMPELGKSYFTDNRAFGRTNNPFNGEYSPGGSSGGDAAAVAAGFCSFALAADTGGSVRVPANFCGLFGLYPTRGTFTDAGMGQYRHSISQLFGALGVIAGSLEDIEILQSTLAVYNPRDPYSAPFPAGSLGQRGMKKTFAYFSNINGVQCDKEIKQSLLETVRRLEALGYRGEEVTPEPFAGSYEIFIILAGQASLRLADILAEARNAVTPAAEESELLQGLRKRIATELPPLTSDMLLTCWHRVDHLRHAIIPYFDKYDFFLSPVYASGPVKHGTKTYEIDGQSLQSQQVAQFANAANVLALPAISFPTGTFAESKLPLGLQLIGPKYSEKMLFHVLRQSGYTSRVPCPL